MAFTDEQKEIIINLYNEKTNKEIAEIIGCQTRSISDFTCKKGLRKPKHLCCNAQNTFTEEEMQYIREHYPYENTDDIAKFLNTTPRHVKNYANRHRIRKSDSYKSEMMLNIRTAALKSTLTSKGRGVTDEQEHRIIELYPDHTYQELEKMIGIGKTRIRNVVQRLSLKKSQAYIDKQNEQRRYAMSLGVKLNVEKGAANPKKRKPIISEEEKQRRRIERERIREENKRQKEQKLSSIRKRAKEILKRKDYDFVPDKELIKLCVGEEKKTSTEPCIGKQCVCFKKCLRWNGKNHMKVCDAYMYLK